MQRTTEFGCPFPTDTAISQHLLPKLRELRKGAERFVIARGPGNWHEIVPSCYNREATLMKFQQHGCLSKI